MKVRSSRPPAALVHRLVLVAVVAVALAVSPATALAHGDEELPASEEAEIAELSEQPARVLAQQALALLQVLGDSEEAAIRLDAALESDDQSDIDTKLLSEATETLDGGDPEGAVPLLDEALSRPLDAASGKALHEAGREFRPATGTQEVVGIVAGAALIALGAWALRPRRLRGAAP